MDSVVRRRDARLEAGAAFVASQRQNGSAAPCPPEVADPFPGLAGQLPQIGASELDLSHLAGGLYHHGALIVRGLMNTSTTRQFREDIDELLVQADRFFRAVQKENDPHLRGANGNVAEDWFSPPNIQSENLTMNAVRMMHRTGSVWTFLSPIVAEKLMRFFEDTHLKPMLREYFSEDPCLSFLKSVLRRVEPLPHKAEWHQDGAFMAGDIKSLNLWIALTECGEGTSSPGMDLIPKRLNEVIPETGENGAAFEWSVSQKTVNEKYSDCPATRPHFDAGDAVFIDHYNVHATSSGSTFTDPRYAIETWFFGASSYARNQIPIAW
ncbi:MAG: phytanoyl-CoA dioxygenase family protein [Pseudomonadota bacterium]